MFLLSSCLSHVISKLSLISDKNLLVTWAKIIKSWEWYQNTRRLDMEFLTDGLTLLKVNGEIPIYESDLTFKYLSVLP